MQNNILNTMFQMTERRIKLLNNKFIIIYHIKINKEAKVF
jgi:hypothetical protein